MPEGFYSVSDIPDYTEYIIKKHETLTVIRPIFVYIIRINKILVFKIKHAYKLELQMPETMKLFGSTKKKNNKKIGKTKNVEKVPGLEAVELVLLQCKLVANQSQLTSEVLNTFMSNRSYAYLLKVQPSN